MLQRLQIVLAQVQAANSPIHQKKYYVKLNVILPNNMLFISSKRGYLEII